MKTGRKTIHDAYEILEEIGKGGMAQVYKARQLSLGRLVAIKEIKPAFAGAPELVERFKREARAGASLVHENIVQVYNFCESSPKSLFIVMEYVEGKDLKTLLREKAPLPPRIAAIIAREVARALAYAHARGFVHRDVKPGNIMLSWEGEVKLMDFGIVREQDSELTRTGAFLGTPNYMAPEQFLGEEITPATDLFALGVVLYESLTGEKPFKADSDGAIAKKIRTEKESKVRMLNPEVPRKLQKITHACLKKDPAKRPASAEELALRLTRFLGVRSREEDKKELAEWLNQPDLEEKTIELEEPQKPPAALKPARPEPIQPRKIEEPLTRTRTARAATRAPATTKTAKPSPAPGAESKEPVSPPPPERPLPSPEEETIVRLDLGKLFMRWLWRAVLVAALIVAALFAFQKFETKDAGRWKDYKARLKTAVEKILPEPKPPRE